MPTIEVDKSAALERFLAITAIPGKSGDEKGVAEAVVAALTAAGLDSHQIQFDGAEVKTRIAGNCGNLIVQLPGHGRGPTTMLSAHMDTVPICVGSQPVVADGEVYSSAATGLGADDRSGVCAILTAAIHRLQAGDQNFPPAVLGFFVQEEVGLEGARHLDVGMVGDVDRAFNFDGGTVEKVTTGAIGGERMSIRVTGIPAHAGVAPQNGASAIVMASRAIADLDARGWHGRIENEHGVGTANVGVFAGGDATNVVTPEVLLRAEARSHSAAMRTKIVSEIRAAFERAANEVANADGECGSVEFESHVDYEAFALDETHPSVSAAEAVLRRAGREPFCEISNGGLDANWLFLHGISAVTIGCGQRNIHTAQERLVVKDFTDACQIATWLITEDVGDE